MPLEFLIAEGWDLLIARHGKAMDGFAVLSSNIQTPRKLHAPLESGSGAGRANHRRKGEPVLLLAELNGGVLLGLERFGITEHHVRFATVHGDPQQDNKHWKRPQR